MKKKKLTTGRTNTGDRLKDILKKKRGGRGGMKNLNVQSRKRKEPHDNTGGKA